MARVVVLPKKATRESFKRRQQIGATLRSIREARGLSIEEACTAGDIPYHTWRRWESGETAIPLERVADIGRALERDFVPPIRAFLQAQAA